MKELVTVAFAIASILTAVSSREISDSDKNGTCANSVVCSDRCHRINEIFMRENGKSHWIERYPSIAKTFQEYKVKVSIEVGIARGGLSYYLLSSVGDLIVHHGIDSFAGRNARELRPKKSSASFEWANAVLYHLSEFGCRFRLHKGFSKEMAEHFPPESVDCIYLDADHSYDGVAADIASYAPLLKPGGLMIFDDYDSTDFHGVKAAVDELAKLNNLRIIKLNDIGNVMIVKPYYRPLNFQIGPSAIHSSSVIRSSSSDKVGREAFV